jgi:hypothetical protein
MDCWERNNVGDLFLVEAARGYCCNVLLGVLILGDLFILCTPTMWYLSCFVDLERFLCVVIVLWFYLPTLSLKAF